MYMCAGTNRSGPLVRPQKAIQAYAGNKPRSGMPVNRGSLRPVRQKAGVLEVRKHLRRSLATCQTGRVQGELPVGVSALMAVVRVGKYICRGGADIYALRGNPRVLRRSPRADLGVELRDAHKVRELRRVKGLQVCNTLLSPRRWRGRAPRPKPKAALCHGAEGNVFGALRPSA